MNQYSFYIVLLFVHFSSSFSCSKRIIVILVLLFVLVNKIALLIMFYGLRKNVAQWRFLSPACAVVTPTIRRLFEVERQPNSRRM